MPDKRKLYKNINENLPAPWGRMTWGIIRGHNLSGQELLWKRIPKDYRLSDRSIITYCRY